jgi:hypothetical protein
MLLVAVEDGDLAVVCGGEHGGAEDYRVVGLNHLVERDPTLRQVLDLEEGWEAERDSPSSPWRRAPIARDYGRS